MSRRMNIRRRFAAFAACCVTLALFDSPVSIASPALKISPINPASRNNPCQSEPTPTNHFDHVLIVVLENQDYDKANDCLSRLVKTYGGRSFSDFWALFHHSYPNYLAMVGGRLFHEVNRLVSDTLVKLSEPSIADRLEAKGKTWKNYAENYPGPKGKDTDLYVRRHVPFLSFVHLAKQHVVDASVFPTDVAQSDFPSYAFYSPNMRNDGHKNDDLTFACKWVTDTFLPTIPAERWSDTLVVVTFDEAAGDEASNNHIATVFLGKLVTNSSEPVPNPYNHYNVLRTIEDNFGVAPLADGDCAARPISGIWAKGDPSR
jgi:hypothetical protein